MKEKKKYLKPAMRVYELHRRAKLLVGSGEPNQYNGPFG